LNQEMNSKLNSVLRELGELSQCKVQLDDSNSILLNEIDSKAKDYENLQSENYNLKAEMSRMGLELSQSLERCRIDANEKIKNEEIRSKSIEVEYNSLRTRYENEKLTQQEREFQYKSQIDQSTRYIKDLEEQNQTLSEEKDQFTVIESDLKTKLNQTQSDLQQKCFELDKKNQAHKHSVGEIKSLKDQLSLVDQSSKSRIEMLSNEIKLLSERIDEVQLERSQFAEGLMKSNEEVERLLNENSDINSSKINEMRELMEKYQNEKKKLEEKHSQSVLQLESALNSAQKDNGNMSIDLKKSN